MIEWLLPDKHAIALIIKDHETVKDLFDDFEKADTSAVKKRIVDQALAELKMHDIVEKELFYPVVRQHAGKEIMNEADEEHHLVRVLIAELDNMPNQNDHRDAKFTVLAENVRHHIREEEGQILPKARELDIDFERLGERILERKEQLRKDGVPDDSEHAMVAKAGNAGSPAKAAARRKKAPARRKSAATTSGKSRTRAKH